MQTEIDNVSHPLMQLTRDLLNPEGRITHQKFIIDDVENITLAIQAGVNVSHVFFYGEHAEKYPLFLDQLPKSIQHYPIRPRTCKKIFGNEKMARVFAIAELPEEKPLSAMNKDIAVLDGLMITGNMGAIIRSALAFGISGVALLNVPHHQLYDRRLIRASRGYLFKLPIACLPSNDFFHYCRTNAIKIVNCSQNATMKISEINHLSEQLAIVLGAETTGVSKDIEENADFQVVIPYDHQVESLNVSVAAAIAFYSRYTGSETSI